METHCRTGKREKFHVGKILSCLFQISHHPSTSAYHCEGNGWIFWQEFSFETKFAGNDILVRIFGIIFPTVFSFSYISWLFFLINLWYLQIVVFVYTFELLWCREELFQVTPSGEANVEFKQGNSFKWNKILTTVHNFLIGSNWVDHQGTNFPFISCQMRGF